jgi:hypothetical protein
MSSKKRPLPTIKKITTKEFDSKFDDTEDLSKFIDWEKAKRENTDEPIGNIKIIKDFLPVPEMLATISIGSKNI